MKIILHITLITFTFRKRAMNKKEILQAFKQAEIDYSKSIKYKGLCCYFVLGQSITVLLLHEFLIPLWFKYSTQRGSIYHFKNNQERLDAIRKVISDLEKEP